MDTRHDMEEKLRVVVAYNSGDDERDEEGDRNRKKNVQIDPFVAGEDLFGERVSAGDFREYAE